MGRKTRIAIHLDIDLGSFPAEDILDALLDDAHHIEQHILEKTFSRFDARDVIMPWVDIDCIEIEAPESGK